MQEVITMSRREVNRNHVIRNVLEGRASASEAARALELSSRQIRRCSLGVRVGSWLPETENLRTWTKANPFGIRSLDAVHPADP